MTNSERNPLFSALNRSGESGSPLAFLLGMPPFFDESGSLSGLADEPISDLAGLLPLFKGGNPETERFSTFPPHGMLAGSLPGLGSSNHLAKLMQMFAELKALLPANPLYELELESLFQQWVAFLGISIAPIPSGRLTFSSATKAVADKLMMVLQHKVTEATLEVIKTHLPQGAMLRDGGASVTLTDENGAVVSESDVIFLENAFEILELRYRTLLADDIKRLQDQVTAMLEWDGKPENFKLPEVGEGDHLLTSLPQSIVGVFSLKLNSIAASLDPAITNIEQTQPRLRREIAQLNQAAEELAKQIEAMPATVLVSEDSSREKVNPEREQAKARLEGIHQQVAAKEKQLALNDKLVEEATAFLAISPDDVAARLAYLLGRPEDSAYVALRQYDINEIREMLFSKDKGIWHNSFGLYQLLERFEQELIPMAKANARRLSELNAMAEAGELDRNGDAVLFIQRVKNPTQEQLALLRAAGMVSTSMPELPGNSGLEQLEGPSIMDAVEFAEDAATTEDDAETDTVAIGTEEE